MALQTMPSIDLSPLFAMMLQTSPPLHRTRMISTRKRNLAPVKKPSSNSQTTMLVHNLNFPLVISLSTTQRGSVGNLSKLDLPLLIKPLINLTGRILLEISRDRGSEEAGGLIPLQPSSSSKTTGWMTLRSTHS